MVRAYLLSFLARQYLLLKQEFEPRYPNAWLVWEPGSWRAPPLNASVAETRLPGSRPPERSGPSDALCFELALKVDRTEPVRIGRAEDNELVIPDATVSREHCLLRRDGDQWHVRASSTVKAMRVAGRDVQAGSETPLASGEALELGEVTLTLLDSKRFHQRVAAQAAKLGG
jgi:pSer/pThr/pTyr-binding forkhead associated (FHA) protein